MILSIDINYLASYFVMHEVNTFFATGILILTNGCTSFSSLKAYTKDF